MDYPTFVLGVISLIASILLAQSIGVYYVYYVHVGNNMGRKIKNGTKM